MTIAEKNKLFQPLHISNLAITHKIVMAPMTRLRNSDDNTPLPIVKDYYGQRAIVPGTLIISEGIAISQRLSGYPNMPGIWRDDQVAAWKEVTDAVHQRGSFIFAQICGMGRSASASEMAKHGLEVIGPSAIKIDSPDSPMPREMSADEVRAIVHEFTQAARNALEAGFDGVEVHGAHGHLLQQFIDSNANQRSDEFGGSVANRSRLPLEVVKAVAAIVGRERVGVRFSPYTKWGSMGMPNEQEQYQMLVKELSDLGLGYLALVEPRSAGDRDDEHNDRSLSSLIDLWDRERALILSGGFTLDRAVHAVEQDYPDREVAIAFGRSFISNPDLVSRLDGGVPLTPYDRATFYTAKSPEGYLNWPSSEKLLSV